MSTSSDGRQTLTLVTSQATTTRDPLRPSASARAEQFVRDARGVVAWRLVDAADALLHLAHRLDDGVDDGTVEPERPRLRAV